MLLKMPVALLRRFRKRKERGLKKGITIQEVEGAVLLNKMSLPLEHA